MMNTATKTNYNPKAGDLFFDSWGNVHEMVAYDHPEATALGFCGLGSRPAQANEMEWLRVDRECSDGEVHSFAVPPGAFDIETFNVAPGVTGAGGWDVSMHLEIEGETRDLSVTLLPSQHNGEPASWGDVDHWVDGATVKWLNNREDRKVLLDEIEAVAAAAIKKSDVQAALSTQ